jgi:hypothetical protein
MFEEEIVSIQKQELDTMASQLEGMCGTVSTMLQHTMSSMQMLHVILV